MPSGDPTCSSLPWACAKAGSFPRADVSPIPNSIGSGQEDSMIRKLWNDESGQGLTEYALLTGAVASMVIALAALFTDELSDMLDAVGTHVTGKVEELP
jgi:Flp pilus assembly pilin Flp